MQTHAKKLLVIIAEAALEKQIIRDARQFGAQGYTIYDVRGGGERGERDASWDADRLVEMKVICDDSVAHRLAEHVLKSYATHYAVTMFTADVGVFRPQKF
ncbi:MAG: transcriptional regulator [Burkholderiaceae bacterium]|jgi:nitrogen regulatory protein P-II 2|nr:transcriptional regulator [Burkholderiaceae bacterium]